MNRGIVITTSHATQPFLKDLLESIKKTNYFVSIKYNTEDDNGWELAGIQAGKDLFDEFIHLMDTTVIKDISLFDKLFEIPGHVFLTNGGYHYQGKFVSKDLPDIPKISTKQEAIALELSWLNGKERTYFLPDLPVHTNVFEDKHGRRNMVLENIYLKKFKGTWYLI